VRMVRRVVAQEESKNAWREILGGLDEGLGRAWGSDRPDQRVFCLSGGKLMVVRRRGSRHRFLRENMYTVGEKSLETPGFKKMSRTRGST